MKDQEPKRRALSRRQLFPLLGGTLILPLLGFGQNEPLVQDNSKDHYETLLRPDGTTVKVKRSVVSTSKVVKQKVTNRSLLGWLHKKPKLK